MDDARLARRLAALEPPNQDLARRRAAASTAARVELARGAERRPLRSAQLQAVAIAVAVALVVTAFSLFTPPGQAFTSWVGDRLGIGDPGEPPTLQEMHGMVTKRTTAAGKPAYVLVRGRVPGFGHYEFVTFTRERRPRDADHPFIRCFELAFPEARTLVVTGCSLPSARHPLVSSAGRFGKNPRPSVERTYVTGRLSPEVASVEIEQNGAPTPVEIAAVPKRLIERFRVPRPFKFFVAFPPSPEAGAVVVTARDASGRAIARRRHVFPARAGSPSRTCALAKQLAREGRMPEEYVARNCAGP